MIPLPKNMETCFSGAAQGRQTCLGFLLCFWKCGKYEPGHPRGWSLRVGVCQGPAMATEIEDFSRAWAPMTWPGSPDKGPLFSALPSFPFPFLSLPSFLFQIYWGLIYVQEMCPWGFTSAHLWTTTRIKGMADSLFYFVSCLFFFTNSYTEHSTAPQKTQRKSHSWKFHYLPGKTPINHLCFIKIAECIKKNQGLDG